MKIQTSGSLFLSGRANLEEYYRTNMPSKFRPIPVTGFGDIGPQRWCFDHFRGSVNGPNASVTVGSGPSRSGAPDHATCRDLLSPRFRASIVRSMHHHVAYQNKVRKFEIQKLQRIKCAQIPLAPTVEMMPRVHVCELH